MSVSTDRQMDSRVAVAPMMDWTDRHCRYFMRLLNPRVRLYTEMITAAALVHGDADRLLQFDTSEHPVALQVGGSEPDMMAQAAVLGARAGYDEININVGCPSERVQSGAFGACLMAEPQTVARCVAAMRSATDVPVTVKTRIGIDDRGDKSFLYEFVDAVQASGCRQLIVHARIAILKGLSPKENRTVPPLNYDRVYQLKHDYPSLHITLNGGVTSLEDSRSHLAQVDGVMIGRQAYHQPWLLTELGSLTGSKGLPARRRDVVEAMLSYVERELASGTPLLRIVRHMLGLFSGQPGARAWRRHLSERAHRPGAGIEVLKSALDTLPEAA